MEIWKIRVLVIAVTLFCGWMYFKEAKAQNLFNKNQRLHLEIYDTGYVDVSSGKFVSSHSAPEGKLPSIKARVINHGEEESGVFRVVAECLVQEKNKMKISRLGLPLRPKESDKSFIFTFDKVPKGKQTFRFFVYPEAEAIAVMYVN